IAASMSPFVSASAFLQSIMPALVRSRSSFTVAAVISAIFTSPSSPAKAGASPASDIGSGPCLRRGQASLSFQRDFRRRLSHRTDVLAARLGIAGTALAHRLRNRVGIEADRTAGVVIARNREGDATRVAI